MNSSPSLKGGGWRIIIEKGFDADKIDSELEIIR